MVIKLCWRSNTVSERSIVSGDNVELHRPIGLVNLEPAISLNR